MKREKVWNKIARTYAKKRYFGKGLFENEKKVLKKLVRKSSVLDVGCGTGRHVRFLRALGNKVVGIDYSINMIKEARKMSKDNYVIGDARFLPFKEKAFDFCVCLGNTIGSINNYKMAIKELIRVARKRIIIEFRHGSDKSEKRNIFGDAYITRSWSEGEAKSIFTKKEIKKIKIVRGQRLSNYFFFYIICDL